MDHNMQEKNGERRYWSRWYVLLLVWLVLLIVFFYRFTQFYK